MSKMTLLLKEPDCPHCAEKIEKRVGELENVQNSNLDFINKSSPLSIAAIKMHSLPR